MPLLDQVPDDVAANAARGASDGDSHGWLLRQVGRPQVSVLLLEASRPFHSRSQTMSRAQRLQEYLAACFTGLWIQSHVHDDALPDITLLCHEQAWRLAVWDVDQGLRLIGQQAVQTDTAGGGDPLAAIRALGALA